MNFFLIMYIFCFYSLSMLPSEENKSDYSTFYVSSRKNLNSKDFFISQLNLSKKNSIKKEDIIKKEYEINWFHDVVLKNLFFEKEYESIQEILHLKENQGIGDCHHAAILSHMYIDKNPLLKKIFEEEKIRIFAIGGTSKTVKEEYIWPFLSEDEYEQKTSKEWEEKFRIQEKINDGISNKSIRGLFNFFFNFEFVPTEKISQEDIEEIGSVGEIKNKLIEIYCNLINCPNNHKEFIDCKSFFIIAKNHKKEVEKMLLENTQYVFCAEKMKISELSVIFKEYERFLKSIKYVSNKNELERTLKEIEEERIASFESFKLPIIFHSDIFMNLINYFQHKKNIDKFFDKKRKYIRVHFKLKNNKNISFYSCNQHFLKDEVDVNIELYDVLEFLKEEDLIYLILNDYIEIDKREIEWDQADIKISFFAKRLIWSVTGITLNEESILKHFEENNLILLINEKHKDLFEKLLKSYSYDFKVNFEDFFIFFQKYIVQKYIFYLNNKMDYKIF